MSSAPLHGLRVIDLGSYISAPLAGVFLADQGADVIQICQPDRAHWCVQTEAILSRGKRKIELNLKDPGDQVTLHALLREADVLLENFRPGVMDRLGLSDANLRSINPDLVVVSMPGYSRHDPRATDALTDAQVSAMCGLFTDLSIGGAGLQLPPTYTALGLPSVYAGLWAAIAALAAVYGRQTRGTGGVFVEVPLLDATMSAAAGVVFQVKDQPARYNVPPLKRSILDKINLSRLPRILAPRLHGFVRKQMPPFFRNYTCADGRELFICAIDNANHIAKLLDALSLREEALRLGFVFGSVLDIPPTPNNINAYRGPSKQWKALMRSMATVLRTRSADEWTDVLLQAGVPASTQRSLTEWMHMPVMAESGVLWKSGMGIQPAAQVDVSGRVCSTRRTAPDAAGFAFKRSGWTNTRTFSPPVVGRDTTRAHNTPLAGLRVLDLANVIAGPSAGRTLAHLGAEVIHVSAVDPVMGPRMNLLLGAEVNQGKHSIALNLHTPEGREVLHRMMPGLDVLLYNKLPEQAARLGVAPEQVHAINPDTVITAVTAYSGVNPGGWEARPSYDPVIQAVSGIMQRFGGESTPQVHGIASCIDYFTGFSGAFATLVGLMARLRGDQHLVARTSLIRTAAWVQLRQIAKPDSPNVQSGGMNCLGNGIDEFLVRARDGWIVVSPHPGRRVRLDEKQLRQTLKWLTVREVFAWAADTQCLVSPVRRAGDLRRSALVNGAALEQDGASGLVDVVNHSTGMTMFVPKAGWLRWNHAALADLKEAPLPGEQTVEILRRFDYDQIGVEALLDKRVVSTGWNGLVDYLPE